VLHTLRIPLQQGLKAGMGAEGQIRPNGQEKRAEDPLCGAVTQSYCRDPMNIPVHMRTGRRTARSDPGLH
jgi:hypothetical protein